MQPPFRVKETDDAKTAFKKNRDLFDDVYRKLTSVDRIIDLNTATIRTSTGGGTEVIALPDHIHDVGGGDGGDLALYARLEDMIVHYKAGAVPDLSGTKTASEESSKIQSKEYRKFTVYWDITAVTGTWLIRIIGYDNDEVEGYDLWMSDPVESTDDAVRKSIEIEDPKISVYLEEIASGSITSTLKYYMRD